MNRVKFDHRKAGDAVFFSPNSCLTPVQANRSIVWTPQSQDAQVLLEDENEENEEPPKRLQQSRAMDLQG